MTKKLRRPTAAKRRSTAAPLPRQSVTRREYAALAARLGAVELQMQRNRTIIDTQGQRLAQLQEQVNALQAQTVAQAIAQELPALTPVTTPIGES